MKTILKISKDYGFNDAYNLKIEDINYLANEINVFCEIKNHNYTNIIEQEKKNICNNNITNKYLKYKTKYMSLKNKNYM